ncbi:hypothetical protein [Xenophilus azovorans]|uniref:hypothetical protein n=1 Tax=Xenophilus azovorans TaxID=151755 RepID=UPI0012ED270A|nr:hypothetical protein [Xenophilus azovorans]
MTSLTALALLACLMLFLLPKALSFGDTWNLKANPIPGVEVVLRDGQTVRGDLSRTWSGDYTVLQADGRVVVFGKDGFTGMTARPQPDRGFPWRSFAPAILLLWAFVLYAGWSAMQRRRQTLLSASL